MKNILIIGYGEMGHAMEHLLSPVHDLKRWNRHPLPGCEMVDLEVAAANADIIIFCVPVNPIAALARRILPSLSSRSISLSIAKGLNETGHTAAGVFAEVYGKRFDYGLLYGPMISEEIRADRPAFAQLGARDRDIFDRVTALFSHTRLYLDYTDDLCGISWSAVLKNVYAMVIGAADELALGDNMRGYLMVAAMHEMDAIVMQQGGFATASHHLAGLGDLVTTATSAGSHHHALGRMLVRGELDAISGEGIHTLAMVRKHALIQCDDYPLFRLVQDMVDAPVDIEGKIREYLKQKFPTA